MTIQPINISYTCRSVLECTSRCLKLNDTCQAFLFDLKKSKCLLGSYVITSGTPRNINEHVFCIQQSGISTQATTQTTAQTTSTAQTPTQTTQGLKGCRSNFTYSTNTSTCLWFSGDPGKSASYAHRDLAALNCQAKGAHLVTTKTLAKLKYLEATYDTIFWVGLRYDSTSQVYVWDEDGSSLTIETHNNIFSSSSYQPSSSECVYYTTFYLIDETSCDNDSTYICEHQPI
ncbi:uncharacterized protein LOC129922002 [Biomphalaria glabrata]|uniref:Uncharacterized protein LOC129922002 n=1 Tax=Biomphalaria glabrata TaxID=6526 RepID=A0A9W2YFW6_BIOGL|nr:uncharacterized protein LOC129922002 [Biomphalaria glabrata]